MSLAKFRSDVMTPQSDGAKVWHAKWIGGRTVAKVESCRWSTLHGEPRVTAYVQGEPDTFFSIPAKCHAFGVVVRGYLTNDDDGNLVFHHCYF